LNIVEVSLFAALLIGYAALEWKRLAAGSRANRVLAAALCAAAFLIWVYVTSDWRVVYPTVLLDRWLDSIVPIEPMTEYGKD